MMHKVRRVSQSSSDESNDKKAEVKTDDKVKNVSNEKTGEFGTDDKVKAESNDKKCEVGTDDKVKDELNDKKCEVGTDDKVKDESNDKKCKVGTDDKVKDESNDKKFEVGTNDKVKDESNDKKGEETTDDKVKVGTESSSADSDEEVLKISEQTSENMDTTDDNDKPSIQNSEGNVLTEKLKENSPSMGSESVSVSDKGMDTDDQEIKTLSSQKKSSQENTENSTTELHSYSNSNLNLESKEKISDNESILESKEKEKSEKTGANSEEELIEWDDEDDYLFYLEEILKTIHTTFFDFHDKVVESKMEGQESKPVEKPSLKNIIPYIKKKVLKGCNIVFSGVIPTNMNPEKSRPYMVAKGLGASIQQDFVYKGNEEDTSKHTTHLVAAKQGTTKFRTAQKLKTVSIVNIDWLWSCGERWERVEEVLFPLSDKLESEGRDSPEPGKLRKDLKRKKEKLNEEINSKRQKTSGEGGGDSNDGKGEEKPGSSDEKVKSEEPDQFSMTYNPMLAFSDDDLAFMDKEVDDEIGESGDESSEDENSRDARIRSTVLKSKAEGDLDVSDSDNSMNGDTPRGWGLKKLKQLSPRLSSDDENRSSSPEEDQLGPEYESETDQDKFDKIMDAFGPETENSDEEYQESVGSVDDEIADAVMKEFLS